MKPDDDSTVTPQSERLPKAGGALPSLEEELRDGGFQLSTAEVCADLRLVASSLGNDHDGVPALLHAAERLEAIEKSISKHEGGWSNAALVVDGIANGEAARLLLAHYGFKTDKAWGIAMRKELRSLLLAAYRSGHLKAAPSAPAQTEGVPGGGSEGCAQHKERGGGAGWAGRVHLAFHRGPCCEPCSCPHPRA